MSDVLPSSYGSSVGLLFGKAPTLFTVETRVYLQSCVYRSEGFLGKVLLRGFGPSLLPLWPLDLMALKFLQSLA